MRFRVEARNDKLDEIPVGTEASPSSLKLRRDKRFTAMPAGIKSSSPG
jgi:hypothetical protein